MNLLNCEFDPVTEEQTCSWAADFIEKGERGYVSTVNVSILMSMQDDPDLKRFVDRSALTVADGMPIVWLSKVLGKPLPERVAGVDLVMSLSRKAAEHQVPIYLLGAKSDVVKRVSEHLQQEIPGIQIVGADDGYFDESEFSERAKKIAESQAGILFVAMGSPRQEEFLDQSWDELGVNLAMGVGGSFEVIAGNKQRAPIWMQEYGFEWLFRLVQEPRRLMGRYLVTNSQFVWAATKAIAQHGIRKFAKQFLTLERRNDREPNWLTIATLLVLGMRSVLGAI
ncbi:MAG: WecB/TagA/CpsF family glycosyltransferase [Planctomycetota bacterium]